MFTRIRNLHPVTGMVIGVVTTLVLSGTALAVTDTSFTYSTTKVGYLSIHHMDLAPSSNFTADGYFNDFSRWLTTSSFGCFNTGVNLPDRAKVVSLQTFYTGGLSGAVLARNNLDTDASEFIAEQHPAASGTRTSVTTTIALDRRTVWNNAFSYGYGICLDAGADFEGARITYTYTSAGD